MARIFPPRFPYSNDPMRRAEKIFYDSCCEQLDDDWIVLYEVKWHGHRNSRAESGDADFLLMNSTKGIFCVEVKGGQKIEVDDAGNWYSYPHGINERKKIKNPFEQVAKSKFVLWNYIKSNFPEVELKSSFGHLVVLPGFVVNNDLTPYARRELICDKDGLKNLDTK